MAMMDDSGAGMMTSDTSSSVHSAFNSALNTALFVGVLASVAAAAVVATVVTRRLLRPLEAVRAATKQIAAGCYDVPLPTEPELAELATDVNLLARALAETETRRTQLLGEVAHEMRTPLTSLDGYLEGMIDGVFAADRDTLASLSAELHRLHRLADDLSSLSRTEEQRLDLHLAVEVGPVALASAAIACRWAGPHEGSHRCI
jgi:histidine kinase